MAFVRLEVCITISYQSSPMQRSTAYCTVQDVSVSPWSWGAFDFGEDRLGIKVIPTLVKGTFQMYATNVFLIIMEGEMTRLSYHRDGRVCGEA